MSEPIRNVVGHLRRWVGRKGPRTADQELLERFVTDREDAAFAALVERYGPLVLGVCRRVLGDHHAAEDAFQATFLVLARKAASIRQAPALAGWLHHVAFRVALRARRELRWRELLGRLPTPPAPAEPPAEAASREALAALDEELRRLPENYRLPIILCCLEGATREEAADRLGWSLPSLKGRLERGRARLQARLARHGLLLSAGPGLLLVPPARSAAPALLESTRNLAKGGPGSPAILALARGITTTMLSLQWKCAAALLLALALVCGFRLAAVSPGPEKKDAPRTLAPKPDQRKTDGTEPLPKGAVALLGTTRLRPFASRVAVSADGKTIVTAGSIRAGPDRKGPVVADDGRTIRLWDTTTGRLRATRRLPGPVVYRATLAPGGNTVALLYMSLTERSTALEIWDVVTAKRLHRLPVPLGLFHTRTYFAPDGLTLARPEDGPGIAAGTTLIRLIDVKTGKSRPFAELKGRVTDLVFPPGGKQVAAITASGTLVCWDRTTAKELWSKNVGDAESRVASSADGKTFLTYVQDLKCTRPGLWDAATGKPVAGVKLPADERFRKTDLGAWLRSAALTPDGKRLVLLTTKQVVLWDLATGKVLRTLPVAVRSVALMPDGKSLVSLGATLQRWDLASGKPLYPATAALGHTGPVDLIVYAPKGKRLATASPTDETVRLWNVATGKPLHVLRVIDVSALAFTPDGKRLLVGTGGGVLPAARVVEEPGGRSRAEAAQRSAVHIFDTATGKLLRKIAFWDQGVMTLAVSADGKTASVLGRNWKLDTRAGRNKAVRSLLDLASGKRLKREPFTWQDENLQGLSPASNLFSPDGGYLLAAQLSGLYLVDLAAGKRVALQAKDKKLVCSPLGFSPDNRVVAGLVTAKRVRVGGFDGFEPVANPEEIILWERLTGRERVRLKVGTFDLIAFGPHGRRLATAGWQGVRVWDLKTGKELVHHKPTGAFAYPKDKPTDRPRFDPRFQAFGQPSPLDPGGRSLTRSLCFSPDGHTLAAGQADTTVLIWRAAPLKNR